MEAEKIICCDKGADNALAYADFNKVLPPAEIIEAATTFFFEDEDAPCGKIWLYMQTF